MGKAEKQLYLKPQNLPKLRNCQSQAPQEMRMKIGLKKAGRCQDCHSNY